MNVAMHTLTQKLSPTQSLYNPFINTHEHIYIYIYIYEQLTLYSIQARCIGHLARL